MNQQYSELEFAVGNTRSCTLELVWQLFLYDKKREIFPEKKQWSNQLEKVFFVAKVFLWLCKENFGPMGIFVSSTQNISQTIN